MVSGGTCQNWATFLSGMWGEAGVADLYVTHD